MRVVVKDIGPKNWSQVVHYKNCHTDIGPYYLENGSIYTGLNKADRERLEEELGFDLSPNSDYWTTFFIRMTDDEMHLNTDDPYDELKYLFLKNHKTVQNSVGKRKATAEYIIVNYDEEAKEENKKSKIKRKAIKEFDKLSANDIRKALRLYGMKADSISAEQCEAKLFDLVEESPNKFLEIWVNNKSRETQFLVETALSKNVLRKSRNTYYYGTEVIGHGLDDAIAFLDDPKNQEIKEIVINEIEAK